MVLRKRQERLGEFVRVCRSQLKSNSGVELKAGSVTAMVAHSMGEDEYVTNSHQQRSNTAFEGRRRRACKTPVAIQSEGQEQGQFR